MGIEEKIKDIEEEIQKTPYNKATSHHIGKLKAKLSKLKEESLYFVEKKVSTVYNISFRMCHFLRVRARYKE